MRVVRVVVAPWVFGQADLLDVLGRPPDVQWIGPVSGAAPSLEETPVAVVGRLAPGHQAFAVALAGPEAEMLRETAERLFEALRRDHALVLQPAPARPEIAVKPSTTARELGLSERDLVVAMRRRLEGEDLGVTASGVAVRLELAEADAPRDGHAAILDVGNTLVTLPGGGELPLARVASLELGLDEEITRIDGRFARIVRVVTNDSNHAKARAQLERALTTFELPRDVTLEVLDGERRSLTRP